MTHDEAKTALKTAVREVQKAGGLDMPDLRDDACPLRDFDGWDSLVGLVATGYVAHSLERGLPDAVNLFVDKDRRLTLSEAAQKLCDTLEVLEAGAIG